LQICDHTTDQSCGFQPRFKNVIFIIVKNKREISNLNAINFYFQKRSYKTYPWGIIFHNWLFQIGLLILDLSSFFYEAKKIETKLVYTVLNPTRVFFYATNSRTLVTGFSNRTKWVDIEVTNENVALIANFSLYCYP